MWSPSAAKAGRAPRAPRPRWLLTHLGPAASVIEHLVAEVVRLGFEVVLSGHPLVAHDEKGGGPRHQGEDGHHDEDEVAGRQAWLRTWSLTWRGRGGHEVGGSARSRRRAPRGPSTGMLREGGVEGSGPRPDGARPPHVAAAS